MKLWIRLVVIGIHLIVIAAILGTCRPSGCRRAQPAEETPGGEGTAGGTSEPDQAASAAADDGDAAGPRTAGGRGWPEAQPRFSDSFFAEAFRPLPEDLRAETAQCRTGVVVDWSARRLLWSKDAEEVVPIASLTKTMTVLLLMEAMESEAALSLDREISVSVSASKIGGRQVWLDPRETFSLEDLLRSVLIHSANDAAYLIAETVAGSEEAFISRMAERAEDLGLVHMQFQNSHGLPHGPDRQENMGSALQVAFLAGLLLKYDAVTEWSGTRLSYLGPRINGKKTQLLNTNKLVGRVPGVNGMKTGYTNKSGYCLAATCERMGRQIIVVVTGCQRGSARDDLVANLIEWAYATP